jgi:plasmid maintenance system antidote protein VapI
MPASPSKWQSASKKALGLRADTLMRMQAAHDLAQARVIGKRIRVKPLPAAA